MGVWIETLKKNLKDFAPDVTPCVGVWIETYHRSCTHWRSHRHTLRGCVDWNIRITLALPSIYSHTLRGCVDWNGLRGTPLLSNILSHPAWVCGLKLVVFFAPDETDTSHPAWVCGLKRFLKMRLSVWVVSHPAWVCGLKQLARVGIMSSKPCHTLRGCVDWNMKWLPPEVCAGGHTLRGCMDWNHRLLSCLYHSKVTPCVGVWIETRPV